MRLLKEIRTLMANYHVKSGIYHHYRNEFKQAVGEIPPRTLAAQTSASSAR